MSRTKMIASVATCLAFAFSPSAPAAQQGAGTGGKTVADQGEIRKAGELLGTAVMNGTNEKIASLADVVISPEGEPLFAVLSHGGVAGVGASYTAAPWNVLDVRHANGKWAVNLGMTEEAMKKAPSFQKEDYKDLTDPQWVAEARNFFRQGAAGSTTQAPEAVKLVLRASKIIDADLKTAQDEAIGEVEELLLDRNYKVEFAIIGRGGVLDIGESFIPVPWSKLRLGYNRESTSITAMTDATKQQLEKAPLVKGDDYSTLLAPGFKDQVRRHFGVAAAGQDAGRQNGN